MLSSSCVFVPGVWHSADGFDLVVELLAAEGLTSWKVGLPSVGWSPPVPSLGPDVEAIYNAVLAEMQQGHDVTVVCHSYGGFPTSQALRGLEKPQSVGGERVSCIVYIAAFLLAEGVSLSAGLAAHIGSANDPFYELLEDGNTLTKKDTNAAERSYNDSSFEEGKYWVRQLQNYASSTFACFANYVAWKDNPPWYLICKQDQAMAPEVQRALVKEGREYLDQAGGSGTGEQMLRSLEIDACHSPFLSRPEVTAAFIESAVVAYRN